MAGWAAVMPIDMAKSPSFQPPTQPTHPPTYGVQHLIRTAFSSSIHPPTHLPIQIRFTPPSAVISGFLGLALYDIMGATSKVLQVELESSLRSIEVNIVNFVFTSLILGTWMGGGA